MGAHGWACTDGIKQHHHNNTSASKWVCFGETEEENPGLDEQLLTTAPPKKMSLQEFISDECMYSYYK